MGDAVRFSNRRRWRRDGRRWVDFTLWVEGPYGIKGSSRRSLRTWGILSYVQDQEHNNTLDVEFDTIVFVLVHKIGIQVMRGEDQNVPKQINRLVIPLQN